MGKTNRFCQMKVTGARLIAICAANLVFAASAMAADLYVAPNGNDSNSGTQSAPFRTIKRADQAATPGTVVHVAPGNYGGGFTTTKNGSSSARIVFISDVKWGAKIVGSGGTQAESAWFSRGNYVDIVGFEVDGASGAGLSWSTGFYLGGHSNTVQGSKIHNIAVDPTTFARNEANGNGGAGILLDGWYGGTDSHAIGNVVYDIGPSDKASNLIHGIYHSTTGSVVNNLVYNVVGDGITLWHDVHDVNIINNTVSGARGIAIQVGSGDGGVGGGALSSRAGNYITVINNIAVRSKAGIEESGRTGSSNNYVNNLVFENRNGNIRLLTGRQSGTITADPRFVNPSAADYRLAAGSPAINAGSSQLAPTKDYAGAARPQGGAYDIGAFEYGSTTQPSPTPVPSTPAPTPIPTPVPPAATPVSSLGAKFIVGKQSGKCLDVTDASKANGAVVQQWTCTTEPHKKFEFISLGNNQYALKAVHSGKCLDVGGNTATNGARLIQYDCHYRNNQRFTLKSMGNGQYSLVAVHSGKCLDVTDHALSNGAIIQQWTCTGGNHQIFSLK